MGHNIKVNGEDMTVTGDDMSFAFLQQLAGGKINTATYHWEGDGDIVRQGIFAPLDPPVKMEDGMVFEAVFIP